jgi:membrane peptidoglycan carboxypeptidase
MNRRGNDPLVACRAGVWPLEAAPARHAWMLGYTSAHSVSVFAGGDEAGGAVDAGLPKAVWERFLENLRV